MTSVHSQCLCIRTHLDNRWGWYKFKKMFTLFTVDLQMFETVCFYENIKTSNLITLNYCNVTRSVVLQYILNRHK